VCQDTKMRQHGGSIVRSHSTGKLLFFFLCLTIWQQFCFYVLAFTFSFFFLHRLIVIYVLIEPWPPVPLGIELWPLVPLASSFGLDHMVRHHCTGKLLFFFFYIVVFLFCLTICQRFCFYVLAFTFSFFFLHRLIVIYVLWFLWC